MEVNTWRNGLAKGSNQVNKSKNPLGRESRAKPDQTRSAKVGLPPLSQPSTNDALPARRGEKATSPFGLLLGWKPRKSHVMRKRGGSRQPIVFHRRRLKAPVENVKGSARPPRVSRYRVHEMLRSSRPGSLLIFLVFCCTLCMLRPEALTTGLQLVWSLLPCTLHRWALSLRLSSTQKA